MKYECELCGIAHEIPSHMSSGYLPPVSEEVAAKDIHALSVSTNSTLGFPAEPEKFAGWFGIWDQRQKRERTICGACLCDRLFGPKFREFT